MMTFECMLEYMHPATRMVSLRVDDSGVVQVVGNTVLSIEDRRIIERYSFAHCQRMNHSFSHVDFNRPYRSVKPPTPGDFDHPGIGDEELGDEMDLGRPDRFDQDG